MSLLSDEAGNDHDKTRLMIVYLLCVQNIDLKEIEELEVCYSECKRNAFYNDLKLRRSKPESSDASSSKYLRKLAQNIYNYVANETKYAATKCV